MNSRRRAVALGAVLLILIAGVALLSALRSPAPPAAVNPTPTTSPTPSATPRLEQTKPPGIDTTQPQLPLSTSVRWAVDKGSPDDPQRRSLLELFFDGGASGFRVVDGAGTVVLRFPIAGSGIFGPETCLVRTRKPQENATWIAVDQATLDLFVQRYRAYRVIAEGIPTREATLELVDSGCRPSP